MEQNVALDPVTIAFFGGISIMTNPEMLPYLIEKFHLILPCDCCIYNQYNNYIGHLSQVG